MEAVPALTPAVLSVLNTDEGEQVEPEYRLITLDELATRPPPQYLIDDLLPAKGLSVMFGASGGGKSFLALDWALSIASGIPWNGAAVTQGPVVFVAAEGDDGIRQRVDAWRGEHPEADPSAFYLIDREVSLMGDSVAGLFTLSMTQQQVKPALVIFDTLSQCMVPGDENMVRDMMKALDTAKAIRRNLDCGTLIVHHTGNSEGLRERGSSSLGAAADARFRVHATNSHVTLTCEKMKNAAKPAPWRLKLVTRGESCVLEYLCRERASGDAGSNHDRVVTALREFAPADLPVSRDDLAARIGSGSGQMAERRMMIDAAANDPRCPVMTTPGPRGGKRYTLEENTDPEMGL